MSGATLCPTKGESPTIEGGNVMKKFVSLVLSLALILSMMILPAQAEGSKLIGVCMQNMSSSISVLEADARARHFVHEAVGKV